MFWHYVYVISVEHKQQLSHAITQSTIRIILYHSKVRIIISTLLKLACTSEASCTLAVRPNISHTLSANPEVFKYHYSCFGVTSTSRLGRPAGWMTHSLTLSHSLFVRMQESLESASSHARQDLRAENCNTWMEMVKRGDRGQDKDERGVRGRQTGGTLAHGPSFYCRTLQ